MCVRAVSEHPGMAFKRRWSLELRDATIAAALDRNWTAREAWAAAVDGRLQLGGENIPPADGLPIGTVRDWVRVARAERGQLEAAAAGPEAVLSRHVAETVALLDTSRVKVRRAIGRGRAGAKDVAELARAGVEVARLVRAVHGNGSSSSAEDGSSAAPAAADGPVQTGGAGSFVDALAAAADE